MDSYGSKPSMVAWTTFVSNICTKYFFVMKIYKLITVRRKPRLRNFYLNWEQRERGGDNGLFFR